MIQAPVEPRGLVDEIVATLISRFHPRRIYLFGSRARGDARRDSDYDFLIEVDKPLEDVLISRQGVTWLRDSPGTEIQVHVRIRGALERRKDDPGTVDWSVVREGRAVFIADGLAPLLPAPDRGIVREPRRGPPPSLVRWVELAERDLRLSLHLAADAESWKEPICFHCQQSAEKFLKALVVSQWKLPLRTHNMANLLVSARYFGFKLPDIDRDCWSLTQYALSARYPDDGALDVGTPTEVSVNDARQAIGAAERVAAAVHTELPRALQ